MTLPTCFWPAILLLGLLFFPIPLAAQNVQSSTDSQGTIRIINPGDAGEGKRGAEVEGVRPEEPAPMRPTPVPRSRQSVLQERQKFFGQGGPAGTPPGAQTPQAAPPVPTPPRK